MDKKFLITYENSGIYRFFSEDKGAYTLSLSAFGERIIPAITQEDEDNYYMREITNTDLREEVLELETQGQEIIIFNAKDYVIDVAENSFVMSDSEIIPSVFYAVGGRAHIILEGEVPEAIKVQLAYHSSVPLVEGEEYQLTIKKETSEGEKEEQFTITCELKNDVLYLGDYDYFMNEDEPEPEVPEVIEIDGESPYVIQVEDYISIDQDQYEVTFNKTEQDEVKYKVYTKELVEAGGGTAAYVGNLSLYKSGGENTEEPFFIITKDFWLTYVANENLVEEEIYYHITNEILVNAPNKTNLPLYYRKWYIENEEVVSVDYYISCVEDTEIVSGQNYYTLIVSGPEESSTENDNYIVADTLTYKTWLYVEEKGKYNLLVQPYNVILIPELAGAALVSFGEKKTDGDKEWLEDNYGIGINSSDIERLGLPERTISLFEAELSPTDNAVIEYKYRGILGTLPDSNLMGDSVNPKIYPNMAKTQGIYTDNMYIGNKDQYVAFYRVKDTGEPRLDVKGTLYVGDDTLDKIVKIQDGSILLGDSEGFHILIDGDKSHTDTYGLGFYEINKRVAYINEQKLYIPYTVVLEGMDVGDKKWRWELQPDTENLTLKWLGGDK